ncbi:MAG: BREX-1 system adenine-specific DNA-methyltransferase PglX [Phycisphaerales bacterium]|nr:BREX-1 system adenine-specific DNA-methyltransferase PglX [Phycisphaerales bacterium]
MDQQTRNKLQKATQDARRLLEHEFSEQLEGIYDILPDGKILPEPGKHLDDYGRLRRRKLVDAIEHIRAGGKKSADAVDEYTREAAFTFLNRFVALKMLEARGLVQQCVSKGEQSSGFKEFTGLGPGLAELPDKGYRLYLECLFDELSIEIKVLFDRRDPASLLWPRRQALTDLLAILNEPELAGVWDQDETIGWVYQYFNSSEERRKMREESQAPRNSREVAVRNQFFTPRYVVEFLTDNTLGRIWYEMRQGDTKLEEQCRYLVRRPAEIFLAEGEEPPEQESDENLSQEELLKQPVYVPFRAKKDPRDLKILDPACGSGHFLLYCFDLLLTIYEEAWADRDTPSLSQGEGLRKLREEYPTIEALREAGPGLILRHNLHGIDIDPRCAQIAAFALWMRAQRAYNEGGIDRASRPSIRRTSIVVAEPMPGEKDLLKKFTMALQPPLLGQLVEVIFDKMQLAGEAGSLLKIEDELRDSVAIARKQWVRGLQSEQMMLFADDRSKAEQLSFDLSGITDEQFWCEAESQVIAALLEFAESSTSETHFRRALFADDSLRGFSFIDICRQRYDAVLMNPPFGYLALGSKELVESSYSDCAHDYYPAFLRRGFELLAADGYLGAITNRTGLLLGRFSEWRNELLLKRGRLAYVADLGHNVLDEAMVEAAAYCVIKVTKRRTRVAPAVFVSMLATPASDRGSALQRAVASVRRSSECSDVFVRRVASFAAIPTSPIAYAFPEELLRLYASLPSVEQSDRVVRSTNQTSDDFRYFRLWWETPENRESPRMKWVPFAKGGEYAPYHADLHLVIDWDDHRRTWNGYMGTSHRPYVVPASAEYFFRPGLTYSIRTNSGFSPRILPEDSIFGNKGPGLFASNKDETKALLALLMSRICQALLEMRVGAGDATSSGTPSRSYEVGLVQRIPVPWLSSEKKRRLADAIEEVVRQLRICDAHHETRHLFLSGVGYGPVATSLSEIAYDKAIQWLAITRRVLELTHEVEKIAKEVYELSDDAYYATADLVGRHPLDYPDHRYNYGALERDLRTPLDDVIRQYVARERGHRAITVKSYIVDRRIEVLAHIHRVSAKVVIECEGERLRSARVPLKAWARRLVSYAVGCAFGRWHTSSLTELESGESNDVLGPLPKRSPGMPNHDGAFQVAREILVDDLGHSEDIMRHAGEVFHCLWSKDSAQVLQEVTSALESSHQPLRAWCRASLFEHHISAYSMSRRKAPIYWQLATSSASYSVWLYYHRFTADTFYKVLNDYVKPKLDHEQRKLDQLRADAGPEPTRSQRTEIDQQETFVAELKTFAEEIELIAPLWSPDLNDGVIINFAPLWRLVPQYRAWQKECKKCWDKLVAGDYDWAHLAMHLWPERVVPKCRTDASLAIAHGLEDVFWEQDEKGKWVAKDELDEGWDEVIEDLVAERTKPALKAALKSLLEAPAPAGNGKGRKRKSRRK